MATSPAQLTPPMQSPPIAGGEQKPSDELKDYIAKTIRDFEDTLSVSRILRCRTWTQVERFWRGRQADFWDKQYQMYRDVNEFAVSQGEEPDIYHIDNHFFARVEDLATEYSKSNPNLICEPSNNDREDVREPVELAQYWVDCMLPSLFPKQALHREAKRVIMRGSVFTRTYRDPFDLSETQEIPTSTLQPTQMMSATLNCTECGNSAELDEEDTYDPAQAQTPGEFEVDTRRVCPQCGSLNQTRKEAVTANVAQVGKQKQPIGKIKSVSIDPLQVEIWDRAETPEDSPYLFFDEVILESQARRLYGLTEIPKESGQMDAKNRSGLMYKRWLELSVGNTGEADASKTLWTGVSSTTNAWGVGKGECRHSLRFLEPHVYAGQTCKADTKLPGSNKILPKGTDYGNVWPLGVCVAMINGNIVKTFNKAKNDEWSGYQFTVPATGWHGSGAEQIVAQQKWLNEMVSIITSGAMYNAFPITVADTDAFVDNKAPTKAGMLLQIAEARVGERGIDDYLHQYQTGGMDESVPNSVQMLKGDMVSIMSARDPQVSSTPNPANNTATGVNYQDSVATSSAGTRTELRAGNFARRMEQALKIAQETDTNPHWMRKQDSGKARLLRAMDIGIDIKVRVEEDSHQPRTLNDRKGELAAGIQMGYGNPQVSPEIQSQIASVNRLKAPNQADTWKAEGLARIQLMQAAEEQAQPTAQASGIPPEALGPMMLQVVMQAAMPDPLDNHEALVSYYKDDWYISDQYKESSDVIKQALHQLVVLHKQAMVTEAQEQQQMQMAAQAPQMMMEQEQQQAAMDQQQGSDSAKGEKEDAHKQRQEDRADREMSLKEKELDHRMKTEEKAK